jgi:hypothetical protein
MGQAMVTNHEMRMHALELFEENERLYRKLNEIHDIAQDTTLGVECWQKLQNIEATASSALRSRDVGETSDQG